MQSGKPIDNCVAYLIEVCIKIGVSVTLTGQCSEWSKVVCCLYESFEMLLGNVFSGMILLHKDCDLQIVWQT